MDAVASHVVGYDPMDIFTISEAQARGLGIGDIGRIEVVGERIEEVKVRNFRHSLAASSLFRRRLPSLLYAYVSGQLILTPEVVPARCTACKDCIRICPAETIELVNGKARINEAGCIHCLCCHEVCSFRSIRLKQRLLGKIASWASRLQGALIRHS